MEMVDKKGGSAHFTNIGDGHVNAAMDTGDYLHPEVQTSPVKRSPPHSLSDVKFVDMRSKRFDSGKKRYKRLNHIMIKQILRKNAKDILHVLLLHIQTYNINYKIKQSSIAYC